MKTDNRIDAYIAKSAEFARPILEHIRSLVHKACPEVVETIKWGFPHFDYNKSMMCSMAGFKQHAVFSFWRSKFMKDPDKVFDRAREQAMGHFGRITKLSDLPSNKIMIAYIKEAMRLNDAEVKVSPIVRKVRKALKTPAFFSKALAVNAKARKVFDAFTPAMRRDYIEWLLEAKTNETRDRRMETAIEWISQGKIRNWKYLKK